MTMHCNRRHLSTTTAPKSPWLMRVFAGHLLLLVALWLVGSGAWAASSNDALNATTNSAKASLATHATNDSQATRILVVGDSISAEYGIKRGTGWVALLAQRIAKQGIAASVINASISGDTTAGGRARLASLIKRHKPGLVIIELGANDALRGLPLNTTQANLTAMVNMSQTSGAKVLLLGMQVPPNYGQRYTDEFAKVFTDTSANMGVPLVPFFLSNVADAQDAPRLFQADRIHPNELAQPIMLDNMWPALVRELAR
ncbi:arylesterase [Comamonadaceae bacterium M7527]|nr:arylesterase [Comamonadaceae bacterium M7527]